MYAKILDYHLDAIAFTSLTVLLTLTASIYLRSRRGIAGLSLPVIAALALLVAGGIFLARVAEYHERARLQSMLEGIAPTYAQDLELMGHSRIQLDTPADDPRYLSMIEAEKRWLKVNQTVNDIYTVRRLPDGKVVLLVDSETDYNDDGVYEGEREKRTPIGEPYDPTPTMVKALITGKAIFDTVPYTDRWGTWVSAYSPMHDETGKLDSILGVDYDVSTWAASILSARAAALGLALAVVVMLIGSGAIVRVTREELLKRAAAEKVKQQLQEALLAASRKAGMADVATGVLHNVGNVLNSLNVSMKLVSEKLDDSKVPRLARAAALMQEHASDLPGFFRDDPKAQKIPSYLGQLADVLAGDQKGMIDELALLGRSVDHIKQIVASQQKFAKNVDQKESFIICELVDDAIRIAGLSMATGDIEVVKQYDACPTLYTDKHRALQIIVNLISNAKKAVLRDHVTVRRITFKIQVNESAGEEMVRVEVIDTGIGIAPENLPSIFRHGFTTDEDGHGFGLHTASNDVQRMGGSLQVESKGLGLGATFTLDLPVKKLEVVQT